ncbi:MAG: DUF6541 family protein [Actinomycetaceae bacterium]|nr:hypothetical protein [Actinomycetaceae bacterium]MDY6082325.1 DUF6541 family protein [Actinomycetaceae bacterium]
MAWVTLLVAACAVVVLVAPGLLILSRLDVPTPLRCAAAPAVSLGIWVVVILGFIVAKVPWKPWIATTTVLVLSCAVAWFCGVQGSPRLRRGRGGRCGRRRFVTPSACVTAVCALAGLLCALPYAVGSRLGERVPQTWDVVFHLSALRFTRQLASADPRIALAPLYGGKPAYYPNVFHDVAALLPGTPVQTYVAVMLAFLLIWPAIMGAFAACVVQPLHLQRRSEVGIACFAAFFAAMGSQFPTNNVANLATPPYTLSLVALPGLLALSVASLARLRGASTGSDSDPDTKVCRSQTYRLCGVCVVAVIGVVATHPTSLFNLAVIFGVPIVGWGAGALRGWMHQARHDSSPHRRAAARRTLAALGLAFLVAIVLFWVVAVPRLAGMSTFVAHRSFSFAPLARLLTDYASGPYISGFGLGGSIVTLLALAGFVNVVRSQRGRRLRWLVTGAATSFVWFTMAAEPIFPLYFLTAPWYVQAPRIAPLVFICEYPVAAWELVHLVTRCRQQFWALACAIVIFVTNCAGAFPGRLNVINSAYDPAQASRGTMITQQEKDFIERAADRLPADAVVWGEPFSGTPFWWILKGVHVEMPSLSWPAEDDEALARDLYDGKLTQRSCAWIRERGISYVYQVARVRPGAHGTFSWVWHRSDVSFAFPLQMLERVDVPAPGSSGSGSSGSGSDGSGDKSSGGNGSSTSGSEGGEPTLYRITMDACPLE